MRERGVADAVCDGTAAKFGLQESAQDERLAILNVLGPRSQPRLVRVLAHSGRGKYFWLRFSPGGEHEDAQVLTAFGDRKPAVQSLADWIHIRVYAVHTSQE